MKGPLYWADVLAVENDLALQFVPVLLDVVVLDHHYDHIDSVQELVEVEDLILDYLLVGEERVEALERAGKVALLGLDHLQGRTLADIVHVLLVGDAVETDAAVVGDVVGLHDLVDAVEDILGLAVVGSHRLIDDLS